MNALPGGPPPPKPDPHRFLLVGVTRRRAGRRYALGRHATFDDAVRASFSYVGSGFHHAIVVDRDSGLRIYVVEACVTRYYHADPNSDAVVRPLAPFDGEP